MATHETDSSLVTAHTTPSLAPGDAVDAVVEAVAKASLQDEVAADVQQKTSDTPARPLRVYARYDILQLSKSPLIELPEGMPTFKEWFGYVRTDATTLCFYNEFSTVTGTSK